MENIRDDIADNILHEILECEFGQDIELISPSGVIYTGLKGNWVKDTVSITDMGQEIVTPKPVVQLRMKSLTVIPQGGQKWICRITDIVSGIQTSYFVEKAPIDGRSVGYIELHLSKAIQS